MKPYGPRTSQSSVTQTTTTYANCSTTIPTQTQVVTQYMAEKAFHASPIKSDKVRPTAHQNMKVKYVAGTQSSVSYRNCSYGNPSGTGILYRKQFHNVVTGGKIPLSTSSAFTSALSQAAWNSGLQNPGAFAPSWPDVMRRMAEGKILEKIAGAKWDVGVELAELSTTVKFVVGTVFKVTKAVSRLKKMDVKGFFKELELTPPRGAPVYRSFSQNWLAYNYAVRPICYSIEDAIASMDQDFTILPFLVKGIGKYQKTTQTAYGNQGFRRKREIGAGHYKYKCHLNNVYAQRLAYYGLSPTQLTSIVWEITPFSFVADWFVKVGDYLSQCEALSRVNMEWGYRSAKFYILDEQRYKNTLSSSPYTVTQHGGYVEVEGYHRQLLVAMPIPNLETPLFSQFDRANMLTVISLVDILFGKGKTLSKKDMDLAIIW